MPGSIGFLTELLSRTTRSHLRRPSVVRPPHPDDDWPIEGLEIDELAVTPTFHQTQQADMAAHPDDWFPDFGRAQAQSHDVPTDKVPPEFDAQELAAAGSVEDFQAEADEQLQIDDLWFEDTLLPEAADVPLPEFPIEVPTPEPERPCTAAPVLDPAARRALLRASIMVDGFGIAERRRREHARVRLAGILEWFPASASVMAIRRLIEGGASIDEIEAMAEIKDMWVQDSSLWLRRSHSRAHGWRVYPPRLYPASGMTWRLAERLLRLGPAEVVMDGVQGDFRDSWFALRAKACLPSNALRPAFCSYPAYLLHLTADDPHQKWVDPERMDPVEPEDGVDRLAARLYAGKAVPELGDRTHLSSIIWTSSALQSSPPSPRSAENQPAGVAK